MDDDDDGSPSSSLTVHADMMSSITSTLILPSPPDSPALSGINSPATDESMSESSLPSVSSSFFFSSSAAPSTGRSRDSSYPHSEHEHDQDRRHRSEPPSPEYLIVPPFALPSALRRPTPFGQTLGTLRLLVLGAQGAGKSFLTGLLLEDNEDVVEVGTWEDWEAGFSSGPPTTTTTGNPTGGDVDGTFGYGKVLRASTDWTEKRTRDTTTTTERYEPTGNVHIVELPGYSQDADAAELISRLKCIIEAPFRSLHNVLHPDVAPSATIASLLASPTSPLYTAMVFLLPSVPTHLDLQIISNLSTHIPLIVLPRLHGRDSSVDNPSSSCVIENKLSAFQPTSAVVLRTGLFHSPETVALLRAEAADRFLKWREVERSVDGIFCYSSSWVGGDDNAGGGGVKKKKRRRLDGKRRRREADDDDECEDDDDDDDDDNGGWSKAKWEAEWMESLSKDVDEARRERGLSTSMRMGLKKRRRERERTVTAVDFRNTNNPSTPPPPPPPPSSSSFEQDEQHHLASNSAVDPIFDPIHLPSLLSFSLSLLSPLKAKIGESMRDLQGWMASRFFASPCSRSCCALSPCRESSSSDSSTTQTKTNQHRDIKLALVGSLSGFCIGVGVGAGLFCRR